MCEEENRLLQEVMNVRTFYLEFLNETVIILKTGGGDRYASLALIETIRLYLSFLSGNSVNLFLLLDFLTVLSSTG